MSLVDYDKYLRQGESRGLFDIKSFVRLVSLFVVTVALSVMQLTLEAARSLAESVIEDLISFSRLHSSSGKIRVPRLPTDAWNCERAELESPPMEIVESPANNAAQNTAIDCEALSSEIYS